MTADVKIDSGENSEIEPRNKSIVPLEYTYAPLIPAAMAALMRLFHCGPALALNVLTGATYCAGPGAFYLLSWKLSRLPGYSFAAALVWSLLSPIALLIPDFGFHMSSVWSARRLYLTFEWDDLPHLTSLTLLPIAVWFLARALRSSRITDYGIAALTMAGMMLANMFGVVLAALLAITIPVAIELRFRPSLVLRGAPTAMAAWVVSSPWLPPSLLMTIRRNAAGNHEVAWSVKAFIAAGIVAFSFWAVRRFSARYADEWALRWMLLFGCVVVLIPVLALYGGLSFVPQPGRYKVEAELAIIWVGIFALRSAVERIPKVIRIVLLVPILLGAARQMLSFHRSADELNAPGPVSERIEYKTAAWVAQNLSGQRVMLGGALGNFLNSFNEVEQLSGQPYTTALNWEQQIAVYTIYKGEDAGKGGAEYSLLWLKAFGAQAVAVPGAASHEYWKPFTFPAKFDGILPVLWCNDDTTIYRVPQRSTSLAHIMQLSQLVRRRPIHGLDTTEVRRFVGALEASTPGQFQWCGTNCALIRTHLERGDIVSTQINYHPGWHAIVNGTTATVRPDGLELMAIFPNCTGECEIRLQYDGGWELRLCRLLSCAALLLLVGAVWRQSPTIHGRSRATAV